MKMTPQAPTFKRLSTLLFIGFFMSLTMASQAQSLNDLLKQADKLLNSQNNNQNKTGNTGGGLLNLGQG
ncbi:MAG TPA: hypothetical protein PLU10_04485, partial [Chitinophagaceae bacterium]|nr:hypothetical protein [Chitinophagaceae bacterium]